MIREDVIQLMREYDTGLMDEERFLAFCDQIECSSEDLEDSQIEYDERRRKENAAAKGQSS